MNKETPQKLPEISIKEQQIIDNLTINDIKNIDIELLKNSTKTRQKTAMVIAKTIYKLEKDYPDIPIQFYLKRIIKLIEDKHLKAYGNIEYIRFSEIQLNKY